jgi:two-component system, OmpR family, sensor kinase
MTPEKPASSRPSAEWDIRSAIRRRSRPRSVASRLSFWYLCTLAGTLVVFAGMMIAVRARMLEHELDAELRLHVHTLAAELRPLLAASDPHLAEHTADSRFPFTLRHGSGAVVFRSAAFPRLGPRIERVLAARVAAAPPLRTVQDVNRIDFRVAVERLSGPRGEPLLLEVAGSTAPNERRIREFVAVQALGILLVLLAAQWGSTFTAARALAPLEEIVGRLGSVHANRLGKRLQVSSPSDDIDRLVVALNQMIDRLEEPVYSARRFAADVSHELQTPITAMRFALEACERIDRSPEQYKQMASDLLLETARMSVLIRDLRLLAVAGAGTLASPVEMVDLGALAAECCDIASAVAEDRLIRVKPAIVPGVFVAANPLHLRRAILNLTDNAVRYSAAETTVEVSVSRHDGSGVVRVRDRGCGIPAADLPPIFEPFYRADPARARDTGGSGLGLAIVEQVVHAHGGRVEVVSTPDNGSTFALHLPLAHASPIPAGSFAEVMERI